MINQATISSLTRGILDKPIKWCLVIRGLCKFCCVTEGSRKEICLPDARYTDDMTQCRHKPKEEEIEDKQ